MTEQDNSVQLRSDVLEGLGRQPRSTPSKYLYDARGSELFEQITRLKEYYVTRADLALHRAHISDISARIGADAHVIELGSGAGVKTRLLLEALEHPRAYTPIDISAAALSAATSELERAFPHIPMHPLAADYTQTIAPATLALEPAAKRRIIYFPGSTIGNFEREPAVDFLARLRDMAGPRGAVLIGVDLIKPIEVLLAAYDDAEGMTAEFNRNLLERLQRELGARLEKSAFAHQARWSDEHKRIEMHLTAQRPTRIAIGQHSFEFASGESIHTESSHKYSLASFRQLAAAAGLRSEQAWLDPDELFSMHWLVADA